MPNRTATPGNYRYGFNDKEKDDEIKGGGNSYDFGARENDPRLARWWSVDPLAPKFSWQSPYVSIDNNPIVKIDPTGKGSESVHVDENGKVLRNYNDGDNTVFVHKNGTTEYDVDKKYVSQAGHSAGGTRIGELGKSIDVNKIFKNTLNEHRGEATDLDNIDWFKRVKQNGEWDLKNNESTIYGVAWHYDLDQKKKTGTQVTTNFLYKGYTYNKKFNAADIGNYHAGYMGTLMGVPAFAQKMGAGVVETLKNKNFLYTLFFTNDFLSAPYGDQKADYYWNTKGMGDAEAKMGKYTDIYDADELK